MMLLNVQEMALARTFEPTEPTPAELAAALDATWFADRPGACAWLRLPVENEYPPDEHGERCRLVLVRRQTADGQLEREPVYPGPWQRGSRWLRVGRDGEVRG